MKPQTLILPANTPVTDEVPQMSEITGEVVSDVFPDESIADVVIGEGPASVYLYYLPTYRIALKSVAKIVGPVKSGGQTKIRCRESYPKLQRLYLKNLS